MFTDKLYTSQREMTGLGIYHYGARFYSPKLGRFLSADSMVPNPANPQDFNRYSYVRNNPINFIDPSGHVCSDPDAPTRTCESGRSYPNNARPLRDSIVYLPYDPGSQDLQIKKPKGSGGNDGATTTPTSTTTSTPTSTPTFLNYTPDCNDPTEGCVTDVGGTWADPAVYISGTLACLATGCLAAGAYALNAGYEALVLRCLISVVCGPLIGVGGAGAQDTNKLVQQAQQQYPNKAGNIELHHIFPNYLGGDPNGEVVAIDAAYHQVITNAFRTAWAYGQGAPVMQQAQEIMQQVYNKFPLP